MRRLITITVALGLLCAGASPAAADPGLSALASARPDAPSLGPAPPGGRLRIALERTYRNPTAVLRGDRFAVHGLIRPYAPGEHVLVSFYHVKDRLRTTSVPVRPARGGTGYFLMPVRIRTPGTITVEAIRRATATGPALSAAPQQLVVLSSHLPSGSASPSVRLMQELLARRRYALNISGVLDSTTARAVMAFRKETELGRSETADSRVLRALLEGRGSFPVRYRGHGKHVEADLHHQVLAEVDSDGQVRRIYEMSSGKPSTPTVVGHFAIYSQTFGTNAKGMVDANYFIGGYAIHGYVDVPDYAASHGCLRVPIPDAAAIYHWLSIGNRVDVYTRGAGGSRRVNSHAGP